MILSFIVDLEAVLPALLEAGATDLRRTTLSNGHAAATVRDPDGILVELLDAGRRTGARSVTGTLGSGPLAGIRRARGRPHPRRPVRRNAARRPRRRRHQDRADRGRPVAPGRVAVRRRAQRVLREHQPQQAQRAHRSHDRRGTGRARRAREDRARAAREPAPVDDPQARARLRVAAPVQPEDRVRGAHRLRARRPGGGVARVRLRDPGRSRASRR